MDVIITGLENALGFVPSVPTYAIRIADAAFVFPDTHLVRSPLYVHVARYWFDDVIPEIRQERDFMFNDEIASRILSDFSARKDECSALLVHCRRGLSRSPAVAMALNDIFGLGQDTDAMKEIYYMFNTFVYKRLIEVAKRF
jgi:predicted protein tyrosine phosphatase